MDIQWKIEKQDIQRLESFVNHHDNPFVKLRKKRNVEGRNIIINKDEVIKALTMCLLTSQQRSGPNTPIGRFLRLDPFPFRDETIPENQKARGFIRNVLQLNDLNRFIDRISQYLSDDLERISKENWNIIDILKTEFNGQQTKGVERRIADYINEWLIGFGPKQSRNFLQSLGLTKYEIPIDSRITTWLNDFGFPVTLSPEALQDKGYYHFVSDGIQALCDQAEIYPCILDAAIFSSYDNDEWTPENLIY